MRNIVTLACLCVLWATTTILAAGPQRYAVIVGINDYADPAIPDLKFAESDAKAVYGTLTDPAIGKFPRENVTLILGAKATPSAIKAALYGLRGVDENDLVIIFYSGHGAKEGDEAFWVTQNAQARALPATALSNTDIRKWLGQIPSQKLVTFLDCCYAASTVKKSLGDPTKLFGGFAGKGRVTIAGSANSQEALEMPEAKAGVFTHFLVQALAGKADTNADGAVTFEEVWSYLGENVRKASVKQGGLHEPVIITESGVTPQFLLTFNPAAKVANDKSVAALRKLFDESKITGSQYDVGLKALTEPAIDAASRARREVFADLTAGRLSPKYLQDILNRRLKEAQTPVKTPAGKPTLAVAPFQVLGSVPGRDAGRILADRLLPMFAARYQLIDQDQLARFCAQDDLTIAGLVEHLQRPTTKGLSKAVKLRAVQYLLVGTIAGSPDGTLSVTARICDWQRGTAVGNRFAQVRAENWGELENRLALLAGRLLGDLGAVDTGADLILPPLPSGVDKLTARIQQLQAIAAELKKARTLYTDKHPRVVKLLEVMETLGKPLANDIVAKLDELQAADTKLAALYKEAHPQRQALSEQIAFLRKALASLPVLTGKELTLDLGGAVVGGEPHRINRSPVTIEQYEKSLSSVATDYPPRTVVLHNLHRVMDPKLSEQERVASLNLVKRLDQNDPDVRAQLTGILADEANGESLRLAVLEMLLGRDDASLSKYAVRILPGLKADSPIREKILAWLGRNSALGVLAETVRLWAKEKSPTGTEEPRFRQTVKRISGKDWDQALLDAINTPKFPAGQEAVEILVARIPQRNLRARVGALTPKTDLVLALKVLIRLFDYFPTNRAAIRGAMTLGTTPAVQLDAIARHVADWRKNYGYRFDVRDFYLLKELARDPMRKNFPRKQLALELEKSLAKRTHVPCKVPRAGGAGDVSDQLSKNVESLSMADIWNMRLLDEMLGRPRVQMALKVMADGDRADTKSAWGGLIFYENGQADAKLYPPDTSAGADDLSYRSTPLLMRDGRASLCRFFGHFEKVNNAGRAGPSADELSRAAKENAYGLVLTRTSVNTFCAHYYSPNGLVISLGTFPLR